MAFFICRSFNEMLMRIGCAPCFEYIHAGEDPALFVSREAPEDNWQLAQRRLAEILSRSEEIMLIGITCGLSAPFVAGQLDYAMRFLDTKVRAAVVLGFSPIDRARNTPIEGWHKTVFDVVQDMHTRAKQGQPCFILNPVIGPEAVTGSTRMKGGSATKFLLEIIFERALAAAVHDPSLLDELQHRTTHQLVEGAVDQPHRGRDSTPERKSDATEVHSLQHHHTHHRHRVWSFLLAPFRRHQRHELSEGTVALGVHRHPLSRTCISALVMNYEAAVRAVYLSLVDVASAVAMAAQALNNGGHIYYLGRNSFGLAAMIDASECQPTYNARFEDVRAFLCGGYETLRNVQGDLSEHNPDFGLSWKHFYTKVVPTLSNKDLVVLVDGAYTAVEGPEALEDESLLPMILQAAKDKSVSLVAAIVGDMDNKASAHPVYRKQQRRVAEPTSPVDGLLKHELSGSTLFDYILRVPLHHVAFDTLPLPVYAELAMKLVLNAITTGAFVLTGKVMKNRMIDLQVSNNKLFYRSVGIIKEFGGCGEETARIALLRSIYCVNELTSEIEQYPISHHVRTAVAAAQGGHRVVPTAVLLSVQPSLKVDDARQLLAKVPIVSQAMTELS
eukprot:m.176301 g.176301  ORF g.176301 m.176301 type:complete len:615 (-) comp16559_c1_seq3:171-2015(-)